jgi:purine-binding chemotaxis protein CheW
MTAMTAPTLTKIVTFALGDDLFAADIFSVERVLRYQQPRAIPNVPSWIEGVIEYQARVVPVINLRRRFEMPVLEAVSTTRILVFQAEGEWIGAVVDAVVEVATMERNTLSPPPPLFRGIAGEYLLGILRRKERLVIVLDVARLLSTNERLVLEQVKDEVAHG